MLIDLKFKKILVYVLKIIKESYIMNTVVDRTTIKYTAEKQRG